MAYVSFNKSLTSIEIESLTGANPGKLYFASDGLGIYIIGTDRAAHKIADRFQIKSVSANLTIGTVFQYIGPDVPVAGIKSGYFYKVVNDGWDEVEVQDISGKEDVSNKTQTINSSSTQDQYPSAKAVYDDLTYLTTAPTADNTSGKIKFVFLDAIPATEYAGYVYFIKES